MRIHVNLPVSGSSSSSSSTYPASAPTSALLSQAPSPLTALTPSGELILIELQGSLEIENQSSAGGQTLGTLSFDPLRPDRPVLMVSHHRLEGKFVNLVRPLAVLEKKVRDGKVFDDLGNGKRRAAEVDPVMTVKRTKRPDVVEGVRSSSPPVSPKRAREAFDFSSSPPRQTPIKQRPVARASGLDKVDENGQVEGLKEGEEEQDEDREEPQTAVYYDVVNVIKRKILFSKRPEPIVRLDTSPTAVRTKQTT